MNYTKKMVDPKWTHVDAKSRIVRAQQGFLQADMISEGYLDEIILMLESWLLDAKEARKEIT